MDIRLIGNNVVIKLPIDLLVYAFNMKEDNQGMYEVKYKRKFAQGVVDYLQNHGDSETGLTLFQEMLDDIFDEMLCNAEEYIRELQEDDDY